MTSHRCGSRSATEGPTLPAGPIPHDRAFTLPSCDRLLLLYHVPHTMDTSTRCEPPPVSLCAYLRHTKPPIPPHSLPLFIPWLYNSTSPSWPTSRFSSPPHRMAGAARPQGQGARARIYIFIVVAFAHSRRSIFASASHVPVAVPHPPISHAVSALAYSLVLVVTYTDGCVLFVQVARS